MRFLLDENAEWRIAVFLRAEGHDVTSIARDYPRPLSDNEVLRIDDGEGRILITNDRDFGELAIHQGLPHGGVIYFRLNLASTAEEKIAWLQRLMRDHGSELDQFVVVTPRGIRIRRR